MDAKAKITGTGRFTPSNIITNFDLEKVMDTTDEWIRTRTGIEKRHHVDVGTLTSDLAVEASRLAIEDAGLDIEDIDFIIAATLSPDQYFPGIGVVIQSKLGMKKPIGALDVRNQCSGFIYGLAVADQFISGGMYKRILLVAAEIQSTNLDFSDEGRDMAVLFGDGAGAVVVEANESGNGQGILSSHLFSDGKYYDNLWMERPSPKDRPILQEKMLKTKSFFPFMNGRHVFINAVQRMPEAVNTALARNKLTIEDVDHLIPHQANDRISLMVAKNLNIPVEKVIRNIAEYGNTTAASIPIALDEAVKEGRIKRGDLVVLTAFGSGYTWASSVIRF